MGGELHPMALLYMYALYSAFDDSRCVCTHYLVISLYVHNYYVALNPASTHKKIIIIIKEGEPGLRLHIMCLQYCVCKAIGIRIETCT